MKTEIKASQVYLVEQIFKSPGLFSKESIHKNYCYAQFSYRSGNANPPTQVRFIRTDGCGGTGEVDIKDVKLNSWIKDLTNRKIRVSEV